MAQIGFTETVYSVIEGESGSFQVCITLTNGVSLNSSHAYGNFIIGIDSTFASAAGQYYVSIMTCSVYVIICVHKLFQ